MKPRPRESGMSLVEALVAFALFVGIGATLSGLISASTRAFRVGIALSSLDAEGRRLLDRVAAELQSVALSTLSPASLATVGSSTLAYNRVVGYLDGEVEYGPVIRLELILEDGEIEDGSDNDGDGLVDELRLVLITTTGGVEDDPVELAAGISSYLEGEWPDLLDNNGNGLVDEPGLAFHRIGSVISVVLTLERAVSDGHRVIRTFESAVAVRN